jgi:tetratricopeptide (TPR) repeat protein
MLLMAGVLACLYGLMGSLPWVLQPSLAAGQHKSEAEEQADRGLRFAREGDFARAEAELRKAVKLSPNNPANLAALGSVLGIEQKLEESAVYLQEALRLDQNNLALRRDLAANQWQRGRLQEAKENLEKVLKAQPGEQQTVLLLGVVMENMNRYQEAVRLLGSVEALAKQRPESVAALARSYYQTGQKEKARAILGGVLSHPANPGGVFLCGQVAFEGADYDLAVRLYASIWSSYPDAKKLTSSIAQAEYRAGRFSECQHTLLGLIGLGYATSDSYNLLAWCYYKQQKFQETVRAFDQAIDSEPSNESNYLDLGKVLIEHHRYRVALAVAQKAVERIPTSYRVWMMKGMVEAKQAHYREAVKSYGQALELNAGSAEANFNLAKVQGLAGMTEEAATTFERGIQRFPRDSAHYLEYAQMLLTLAETSDAAPETRALALLNTAVAIDGSLSEPHYQLGNLALRQGNVDQALKHLEIAEKLNPQDSKIHYALARAYRRLGLERKTAEELEAYEKLKPKEETPSLAPALNDNEAKKR